MFADEEAQTRFLAAFLNPQRDVGTPLGHMCVVARTNAVLNHIEQGLQAAQISVSRVNPREPDRHDPEAVRWATMHRVKGLEFEVVILASVNDGLVPLDQVMAAKGDAVERRQADLEREPG